MTGAARRTFRWYPVDGGRHAIPGDLQPTQTGETLCRHPVAVRPEAPTKSQWLWPTCSTCYELARNCRHVALTQYHERTWAWNQYTKD